MANPVTWFEIIGPDPEAAARFYAGLLGWKTQSLPEQSYVVLDTEARDDGHGHHGINGGLGKAQEGAAGGTVVYVECPDIQAVLDRAETLGATVVLPRTETEMVTFAMFTDPQGMAVGLAEGEGTSGVTAGENAPVTWFELTYPDAPKAWAFFRELFGWEITDVSGEGVVYGMVDTGTEAGIPGGVGGSFDGGTHSRVYAQVDDLEGALQKADGLGATVTLQPTRVAEDTTIGMIEDPHGNEFGLMLHQH